MKSSTRLNPSYGKYDRRVQLNTKNQAEWSTKQENEVSEDRMQVHEDDSPPVISDELRNTHKAKTKSLKRFSRQLIQAH